MRTRITVTDLRAAVECLNFTTGNKPGAVGSYVLCGAYGGWQLQRLANASGGVRQITYGYLPARDLLEQISAFRRGYEQAAYERDSADLARATNGTYRVDSTPPEADTATCDGCEHAFPADQVDVHGTAEHGLFGLCQRCKAKDAAAAADSCPVTGDTYGLPA